MRSRSIWMFASIVFCTSPSIADEPAKPESPLVKALKANKVPEERMGPIVASITKRGSAADLAYILNRAVAPDGFSAEVRLKALESLAESALSSKTRPDGDLSVIASLIAPEGTKADPALRSIGLKLAGEWKVRALSGTLAKLVADQSVDAQTHGLAFEALASIGDDASKAVITREASSGTSKASRMMAVAALAKLDPKAASAKAAELVRDAEKGQDFTPLLAPFLNRQGGADLLASALGEQQIPSDNAKLALRAIYALGRADESVIAVLSKSAGLEAETKPPSAEDMQKLIADVTAKGDAARGERIFRRPELNCIKCHALSGAGGGVGPELSAVGLSSPIEFVINSILMPDQAIKEQYHTLIVATADGQVFQGIVADKDEQKVVLREATGELRTVPASEIEDSKPGGSLMPKGLANLLTRDEFLDVVKFVSELGKPGPYAIHAVPTIQRWMMMKTVPEDLAKAVPDAGAFVAKIRDSDPSQWTPVYAFTSGVLPLDEFAAAAKSPVVYLQGFVDVSVPGPVMFRFEKSSEGVHAWLDDAALSEVEKSMPELAAGRHTLTLRIDTNAADKTDLKVGVVKLPGSAVEFVVVGGR